MSEPATPETGAGTGAPPAITVVLVTPTDFANARRVVAHLRAQTIADRLELILVAPSLEAVSDAAEGELGGFARQVVLPVGPIENVDRGAAIGALEAASEIVAILEDHAFPEPGWAEAMVNAHRDEDLAVVGSAMLNANPRGALSWVNLLIAYGPSTEPEPSRDVRALPGHNVGYKKRHLVPYGEALGDAFARGGELPNALARRGERFGFTADARVAHLNPSRLSSTAELRFNAGRLYAATRQREGNWSWLKRLAYFGLGPAIPVLRLVRFRREYFSGGARAHLRPRIWGPLLLGLSLDAAGQMAGYVAGPGRSAEVLATFEMDRRQHLTRRDRAEVDAVS